MEGQIICVIWIVSLMAFNYIIYFGYTKNKYFDPVIENKN